MAWARSAEERRWWRASFALLALIYLSLWPVQFALDFLRERNLLRVAIAAIFGAALVALLRVLVRRRAGRREWLALAGAALVYLAVASRMTIVQERLHLAEYGALALLFRAALGARVGGEPEAALGRGLRVEALAIGLAAAAGLLDEVIQGILPNRQYDLRDVGFNALAAAMAVGAARGLDAARARDRRAREGSSWNRV